MPIVGITRQGNARLKTPYGPKVVGIINIRTSEREAAPENNFFWYELCCEESVLKALHRLHPVKIEQPQPAKIEKQDVIPAEAGIQDKNNQEVSNNG